MEIERILSNSQVDFVIIYYSGHGKKLPDGDLYLQFNDTKEDRLVTTSLSFEFINTVLKNYPSKKSVAIILDCCYSGVAKLKYRDASIMETLKQTSGKGTIILTSTGEFGSPIAKEHEDLGHGIFTYYLIEGLEKGTADIDKDGYVSIDELYDYAYKKTIENSTQSPKREGRIEGTFFVGTYPQKVREKEYEAKKKKLFESRNVLHFNIYDECQTILRKSYKTPSLLKEDDNFILNYLEIFLKDDLLPERREDIKQNLIEAIQLVKEKGEQERKSREEEKTRKEEEKARKEKEEQERKQREEEKARKEREEQKRKEEEERKNLLPAVKKPIESGSKTVYERPMEDEDWNRLLQRIKDGKCTPFLGAGVSAGKIPVGSQIASEWAKKYEYPMEDSYDLARVAKYVAVIEEDEMFPREEICKKINEQLKEVAPKYFEIPDEIH